jgi:hypothetical protein
MKPIKMCLRMDEDDNWYCIPANEREQFTNMLYNYDQFGDTDYWELFDNMYGSMKLKKNLEDYSFENFELIE